MDKVTGFYNYQQRCLVNKEPPVPPTTYKADVKGMYIPSLDKFDGYFQHARPLVNPY